MANRRFDLIFGGGDKPDDYLSRLNLLSHVCQFPVPMAEIQKERVEIVQYDCSLNIQCPYGYTKETGDGTTCEMSAAMDTGMPPPGMDTGMPPTGMDTYNHTRRRHPSIQSL